MTNIKSLNFAHIFILTLSTIIFFIPTVKADIIIPSLFNSFSFFHLIYLIPVILIEATIAYFLLISNFLNYKIKYWQSLFMFLCANVLTTAIGFIFPLMNQSFHYSYNSPYSYVSLVLMYAVTSLLEAPVIFLFIKKKIEKPLKIPLVLSFLVNIFSYIFLILITGTQFSIS